MAIYHLSVKNITRSDGRSSVAAAAYRAGERLHAERDDIHHDYSRRGGVVHAEVILPDGAPSWMADRQNLWNAVEDAEKRKDSRLAKEVEIALPKELDHESNINLARQFSIQVLAAEGVPVDCAFHDDGNGNPHAHLLMPTRSLAPDGFAKKKNLKLDDKAFLEGVRLKWQDYCNTALDREELDARVDHRTLEAQGIDREPGTHHGPNREPEAFEGILVHSDDLSGAGSEERPGSASGAQLEAGEQTNERVQRLHLAEQELANYLVAQQKQRDMARQYQLGLNRLQQSRAHIRRRQDQLMRLRATQDKAARYSQRQAEWLHELTSTTYRQPDNAWHNLFRLFSMQSLDIFGHTVSRRPALFGELQGIGVLFWKSPKRRAAHNSAARLPKAMQDWQQAQQREQDHQRSLLSVEQDITAQKEFQNQLHTRLLECPAQAYDAEADRERRVVLFQARNQILDQLTPDDITASDFEPERQQQLIDQWQRHELQKRKKYHDALPHVSVQGEDPFVWQRDEDDRPAR